MAKEKIVNFQSWKCKVEKQLYTGGYLALLLIDIEDGMSVAKATIFVEGRMEELKDNEVWIKSYSENEGMDEALRNAGIIGQPQDYCKVGYCVVHKYKIKL